MEGGGLLQTRIGGVPLVGIVGLGAGAVAILLAVRSRAGKQPQSGADMITPSAAEAFTQLSNDQQDLGNAISALSGQTKQSMDYLTSAQSSGFEHVFTGESWLMNQFQPGVGANPHDPNASPSFGANATTVPSSASA